MSYIGILITYILVSNLVLVHGLGIGTLAAPCPTRTKTSVAALIAVSTVLSGILGWIVRTVILLPLKADYLSVLVSVMIVAGIGMAVLAVVRAYAPEFHEDVKAFAPHVLTDGIVMGLLLIIAMEGYGFGQALFASAGTGLGFLLVAVLLGNIHERLLLHPVRKSFSGLPILFVSLGLMALVFSAVDSTLLTNLNLM
ncbi:Rnf-Nqr domain containing protein [Parasphaerochaeta coccoides]|uniref:Electron transport complex, RnfABCDGE type, A subunit n=1 Tax=Parasphaerochaeta coccoides (strain ATCC BAA-1237 / DSM 17374 / SPN1) TaxID=760011 RepID=F4GJC3_PARC1|nr:Rnf-Nqr domain containing protein [Parasphaerochaeta coccoides]AEC01763.1 electron transport complex, RnfABCDGE type, A subunit [Parasphaerochaeta coccoides DSM 17374]